MFLQNCCKRKLVSIKYSGCWGFTRKSKASKARRRITGQGVGICTFLWRHSASNASLVGEHQHQWRCCQLTFSLYLSTSREKLDPLRVNPCSGQLFRPPPPPDPPHGPRAAVPEPSELPWGHLSRASDDFVIAVWVWAAASLTHSVTSIYRHKSRDGSVSFGPSVRTALLGHGGHFPMDARGQHDAGARLAGRHRARHEPRVCFYFSSLVLFEHLAFWVRRACLLVAL